MGHEKTLLVLDVLSTSKMNRATGKLVILEILYGKIWVIDILPVAREVRLVGLVYA